MQAFQIVTLDLFHFVFYEWFGWRKSLLSAATRAKSQVSDLSTTKFVDVTNDAKTVVVSVHEAHIFALPTVYFDGVLETVDYGTELKLLGTQNRWLKVAYDDVVGWVLQESVSGSAGEIQFGIGQTYTNEHEITSKLRQAINHEFRGELVEIPLQDVEYVTYRLGKNGKRIVWGSERPRTSGRWQNLLRGHPQIFMSVMPEPGVVMETIDEGDTGHLAYVEDVYEDGAILVSEIGWPEEGRFNERLLPKDEWREYRPVFIKVK